MTRHPALQIVVLSLLASYLLGCKADSSATPAALPWHHGNISTIDTDAPGNQVTIIIALSSIVPGGIIGHAGIAVDDAYWDFGPQRHERLQPIKSIRSTAGPWWDDPQQQWTDDRTLTQVLDDMPDKVHPIGSLVAIFQIEVTPEQAQAIAAFWQDTYDRMHHGGDTYRLTARQCASMVAWSLRVGLQQETPGDRLPRDLHRMTPTRLYETLSQNLTHTAGPHPDQPAHLTYWQLDADGFELWYRPELSQALQLPELPRVRLAYERLKYLPADLLHKTQATFNLANKPG